MNHQLTLEIPDEVYLPLLKQAEESGQTVEEIAGARLAQTVITPAPGSLLRKWIGAMNWGPNDVASRHHEYIGEGLYADLKGTPNGTDDG
jgi:hypothetical protein